MADINQRPKFLNLLRIKLPVGAVASIAHRISGILLFLAIPFGIYLLDLALAGPEAFERSRQLLASPLVCIFSAAIVWALAHHLFAGIRFLLLDLHMGVSKTAARRSAWTVNILGLIAALIYMTGIW